ncbi:DUF1345 domain-containing protein [Streptomyces sp. NPDC048297]|uniref:DUF1345 domain-containing protein n=1 Tax=Streptomyces sp. NPDC048297 TaxID=3365531 RepID=UPI0037240ED0
MQQWLSERRRSAASLLVAACTAVVLRALMDGTLRLSAADFGVLVLFGYLLPYLGLTVSAFASARPEHVRAWAQRETRGTVLQRWVLGTAPGPGVSILIAAAAFTVAVLWLPGHLGSAIQVMPRDVVALALVVVAWVCVVVSFAVTFQADDLVEDELGLEFPGEHSTVWADYVYFALSVMTTFGTTDVNVTSREMRRTVATHGVIAFIFNTVTVATLVSALQGG